MFKKTTLALAVSGLLGASAAQAAMVYDQDGTTLDIYGRISMGIEGGGDKEGNVDNGEEFNDFGSRLRVTAGHQITSDLRAFARVEWRFNGDEQSEPGFEEVRNSYIGLESEQFGTFTAGNFDSFYDGEVMGVFDVYVENGYEFAGGGLQARGDSLAYMIPEFSGFQAFLAAKHFSERGNTLANQSNEGSVIATQGGVVYTTGPLRLALGYVEDTVRGEGNGEHAWARPLNTPSMTLSRHAWVTKPAVTVTLRAAALTPLVWVAPSLLAHGRSTSITTTSSWTTFPTAAMPGPLPRITICPTTSMSSLS
mgnify:CR=1 FL=1